MVPVHEPQPSPLESLRLLETGWAHKKQLPKTLFVPTGQFQTNLTAQAKDKGIEVISVVENQLLVFTGEARQSFRQFFQGSNNPRRRQSPE